MLFRSPFPIPGTALEIAGVCRASVRESLSLFESYFGHTDFGRFLLRANPSLGVVEVVEPLRDQLDAVCIFPSMPAVMKLNKIGSFTMASMGQSKNVMMDFMKKNKPKGTSLQDGMLKVAAEFHRRR